MNQRLGIYSSIALIVSVLAIFNSCDESLPAYRDPGDVLSAGQEASYVITVLDNSLKVIVFVVNTFDETFQAKAFFNGTVVFSLANDPTFRRTFTVGASNIIFGKYNSSSQELTLNPGDTVKFLFSWNFIDEGGRNLRDLLHYKPSNICCPQRLFSDSLTVNAQSELKVFEKINFVSPEPIAYTFQHQKEYVAQGACIPPPNRPECQ